MAIPFSVYTINLCMPLFVSYRVDGDKRKGIVTKQHKHKCCKCDLFFFSFKMFVNVDECYHCNNHETKQLEN
jgi:hypothetical protein